MRKILFSVLGAIFCVSHLNAIQYEEFNIDIAKLETRKNCHKHNKCHKHTKCCKRGPTGPTGPIGPTGPTGALTVNFGSFWDTENLLLAPVNTQANITFGNNEVTPVGITHPFLGQNFLFQIQNSGLYSINWTISAEYIAVSEGVPSNLYIFLFNNSAAELFEPFPIGFETFDSGDVKTVSGQVSLFLPAGTVISLQAEATQLNMNLTSRVFSITQIAQ